jgi:hypothetical protein
MKLEITRVEGLRNDLLLRIDRAELQEALLSVANRQQLLTLPGMPRHRPATPEETAGIAGAKVPIDEHLRRLEIVGPSGRARRRAIAISNRNLGTNHGHLAWQRSATPRIFRILEDPADYGAYSSVTSWCDGRLSIEDLRFDGAAERVLDAGDGRDLSDEIAWATFGQRVLARGRVARIEDLLHQFYDLRHVLAFDHHRAEGERIQRIVYDGYPGTYREHVLRAWREEGVPRARYFHNALGVSDDAVFVLQREGTVEEIGESLKAAGAEDGVILDNGGSVVCWVWWANSYAGGIVSPTVDYRPPGTSAIAFVLKGPVRTELPGGSVSYSVY